MKGQNMSEILKGLEPLFKEAKEKDLIFYCRYQGLYFTPQELRDQHGKGKFVWGFVNWEVVPRNTPIKSLERLIARQQKNLEDLKKRFG
jgi:hypothetical protein